MKLSVKDISTKINNNTIIEDISLSAGSGAFIGLIGANGSGKSTVLKTIYRVLKPITGTVFLNEQDLSNLSLKRMAQQMSVVSQFNSTDFDFTVFDFVMMGRYPYKKNFDRLGSEDKAIVISTLETTGMIDYQQRMISTLSGGEKQRVIVARALAQQPQCIILDEPTNHLDMKHQLQLFSLLKRLHVTTVIAIHDITFAYNFCDQIYALKGGRMIVSGAPEEVITARNIENIYGVKIEILKCENHKVAISYNLSSG